MTAKTFFFKIYRCKQCQNFYSPWISLIKKTGMVMSTINVLYDFFSQFFFQEAVLMKFAPSFKKKRKKNKNIYLFFSKKKTSTLYQRVALIRQKIYFFFANISLKILVLNLHYKHKKY